MKRVRWTALGLALLVGPLDAYAADPPTGLDGYCPVCLVKMDKLVKGTTRYSSVYDGRTYLFPAAEQKRTFDANPAAFVPALGGDCTVCKVEMGKQVAGKPRFHTVHDGRLYLFPSKKQQRMFEQQPEKYVNADLALDGACPVCLVKMNKVVKGDPTYAVVYDGRRYLFPGTEQKQMFEKSPAEFTPALGGDCTVCKVEMKKDVPGKAKFHAVHDGRLFLFPGQKQLDMFNANPRKYTEADVALGGKCVVCKVEMGEDVEGKPEFAVDYRGRRYLFPSPKQREMFLANPEKYVNR